MSRRAAAARFGVSESSAIKWMQRFERSGSRADTLSRLIIGRSRSNPLQTERADTFFEQQVFEGDFCAKPRRVSKTSGGRGDGVAHVADQAVDQRFVLGLSHHADDGFGARRADD